MAKRRGPAPLSDAVVYAMGHLVDDSQTGTRQPSHYDLQQQFERSDLSKADPNKPGNPPVGKRKRVQAVLSWALDNDEAAGEKLVGLLLALLRSLGGFRNTSSNYVGDEPLKNAQEVFRAEGFTLTAEGDLLQELLDNLSGVKLTEALRTYVRRAKRGADDAALVTGTGKDLVEATAAHVLEQRTGTYPSTINFPTLLAQAYMNLGMCYEEKSAKTPQERIDAGLYQSACAVNGLRNKQGTGHGRPFLPAVTASQARTAIEIMGVVAERLLVVMEEGK